MKRIILVLILAAFAWSIQACTNRNREDIDNNNFRDSPNYDTMVTPPLDTNNQRIDTTGNQFDTINMNKDTLMNGR